MIDVNVDEFIVLDTETTGFDPNTGHKIIEVGAITIKDGIPTGSQFHEYVDPEREIPFEATEVHGMTRQDCIEQGGGRIFKDIADDLFHYLEGKIVVAHNAPFDFGFLDAEFLSAGLPTITDKCTVIDSLGYANGISPTKRNSLDQLSKRYGVTDFDRSLHGALLDSQILASVFMAMRKSQQHLTMSEVLKSTEAKKRVFNLADVVRPISQEIAMKLPLVEASSDDLKNHDDYLSKIDDELTW